ncbi:MAG: hypothetical protein O3A00_16535 [Planctomycetota bacterium]|nr:hypothetical protein [Planctomycetota bacterium]
MATAGAATFQFPLQSATGTVRGKRNRCVQIGIGRGHGQLITSLGLDDNPASLYVARAGPADVFEQYRHAIDSRTKSTQSKENPAFNDLAQIVSQLDQIAANAQFRCGLLNF